MFMNMSCGVFPLSPLRGTDYDTAEVYDRPVIVIGVFRYEFSVFEEYYALVSIYMSRFGGIF